MRTLRLCFAVVPFVAMLACASSSTTPSTDTSGFIGSWTCTQTVVLHETTPKPGDSSYPGTSMIDITSPSSGTISIKLSQDGGVSCPLTFSVAGSTATLNPGQMCPVGLGSLIITYTSGTGTLNNTSLTGSYQGTVAGKFLGADVTGTATVTYNCAKN